MTKEFQKAFRFDEGIVAFLDTKENKTEYITQLIIKDMSEHTSLLVEIQKLQEEEKNLKIKLKDNELQQQNLQQQLELTKKQAQFRADLYTDCVETLKGIKLSGNHVTLSDIRVQASRCGVDLALFKRWLFDDGVYDILLN